MSEKKPLVVNCDTTLLAIAMMMLSCSVMVNDRDVKVQINEPICNQCKKDIIDNP